MLSYTFFAHWLFNMPLTTEEEIDLAGEVRKFPALYDKKNSQYHEREVVRNCWSEVAATLRFVSGDTAKRYSDDMRKRFNKARNKIKTAKRSGASRCFKVFQGVLRRRKRCTHLNSIFKLTPSFLTLWLQLLNALAPVSQRICPPPRGYGPAGSYPLADLVLPSRIWS